MGANLLNEFTMLRFFTMIAMAIMVIIIISSSDSEQIAKVVRLQSSYIYSCPLEKQIGVFGSV